MKTFSTLPPRPAADSRRSGRVRRAHRLRAQSAWKTAAAEADGSIAFRERRKQCSPQANAIDGLPHAVWSCAAFAERKQ
jgi:hypothetical protein